MKNSVVIIDEAHNVLETIAHMHSAEVSQAHIEHAQSQVKNYFKKFQKMLKAKNLLYIKHILTVLAKLKGAVKNQEDSKLIQFGDFLVEMDSFDKINLFKLIRYIEKSRICYKLQSYNKQKNGEVQNEEKKIGVANFLSSISSNVSTRDPIGSKKSSSIAKFLIQKIMFIKGHLNLEWIYQVIVSHKMPIKNYKDFCPTKQTRIVAKKTAYTHQKITKNQVQINR